MYCKNCGEQIDDNAEICPKCGIRVKNLSIITLLEQMGLPGFRSRNKWNMIIATLIYISIFLIITSGIRNIDNNIYTEFNQSRATSQIEQTATPIIYLVNMQNKEERIKT